MNGFPKAISLTQDIGVGQYPMRKDLSELAWVTFLRILSRASTRLLEINSNQSLYGKNKLRVQKQFFFMKPMNNKMDIETLNNNIETFMRNIYP